MNNHQDINVLNQKVKPTNCAHRRVTRKYVEDSIGTTEKQYCTDCDEFIESKFFMGKKTADFEANQSVWRHHL
jgi:hypothetical protein